MNKVLERETYEPTIHVAERFVEYKDKKILNALPLKLSNDDYLYRITRVAIICGLNAKNCWLCTQIKKEIAGFAVTPRTEYIELSDDDAK